MDLMNRQQSEREAHRAQASREELVERIARAIREDGTVEPLEGLPAEQPAFVLSKHATQAEAKAQAEAFDKRGLKGLRVLALKAASNRHTLVIAQADGLLAARLKGSKDPALAELLTVVVQLHRVRGRRPLSVNNDRRRSR